jgi:hypothetical protein
MDDLEKGLLDGAKKAEASYENITGGHWLSHAPESFIQVVVALELSRLGHGAYIDASHKKLHTGIKRGPGRPMKRTGQRPDISIWDGSGETIRAYVEIKKAGHAVDLPPSVRKDAKKIEALLKSPKAAQAGYLLVYIQASTKRKIEPLKERFERWARVLRTWELAGCVEGKNCEAWVRATGLFRYIGSQAS